MELYEIKNGLDKAHLLIAEYRKSAQIDEKLREISSEDHGEGYASYF